MSITSSNKDLHKPIPCVLEVLMDLDAERTTIPLERVASELKCSITDVEKAVEEALKDGLIEQSNDTFRLTDEGRREVQRHRERYVHEKYAHRPRFLSRFFKSFKGDWRSHWHRGHGFDEKSLDNFFQNLSNLEGRVEDAKSLASLKTGEKGTVVFTLGGYGLIQRLAEMGLTPGTEVVVVRHAPFRGPVEVEVRGVSLALGYGVASKIFVKPLG